MAYDYTWEEMKEMREWLTKHYHFNKLEVSDYLVKAFLKMRDNKENLHIFSNPPIE